mmetsp:Transcript_43513/g.114818  ORF Transcript_43513/g.114818 Transcript_43513/m.114818 type:complete len:219 (+) Transcript_43513:1530-2186(+)
MEQLEGERPRVGFNDLLLRDSFLDIVLIHGAQILHEPLHGVLLPLGLTKLDFTLKDHLRQLEKNPLHQGREAPRRGVVQLKAPVIQVRHLELGEDRRAEVPLQVAVQPIQIHQQVLQGRAQGEQHARPAVGCEVPHEKPAEEAQGGVDVDVEHGAGCADCGEGEVVGVLLHLHNGAVILQAALSEDLVPDLLAEIRDDEAFENHVNQPVHWGQTGSDG